MPEATESADRFEDLPPREAPSDLDLEAAAKAEAAAERTLSAEDLHALEAEVELPGAELAEEELEGAELGEAEMPSEGRAEAVETDLPEFTGDEAELPTAVGAMEAADLTEWELLVRQSIETKGVLPDLHFVDAGTGNPLATGNVDPFAALGESEAPPWPFDGEDIPEI